jgi:hypothetical protein
MAIGRYKRTPRSEMVELIGTPLSMSWNSIDGTRMVRLWVPDDDKRVMIDLNFNEARRLSNEIIEYLRKAGV